MSIVLPVSAPMEFGRLLRTYAGWGIRIVFVPEKDLGKTPTIEVREPEEEGG